MGGTDGNGWNFGKEGGLGLVMALVVTEGIEVVESGNWFEFFNKRSMKWRLNDGELKLEGKGGFTVDEFNSFSIIEIKFLSSTNPTRHSLRPQFFVDPPFLLRIVASSLCPSFLERHSLDLWLQRP